MLIIVQAKQYQRMTEISIFVLLSSVSFTSKHATTMMCCHLSHEGALADGRGVRLGKYFLLLQSRRAAVPPANRSMRVARWSVVKVYT